MNEKANDFLEQAKKKEGATVTKGGVVIVPEKKGVGMYPTAASTVEVMWQTLHM